MLDYQIQQYRLLPLLSAAYCFNFASKYMLDAYEKAIDQMSREDFSALPEVSSLLLYWDLNILWYTV